MTAAPEFKPLSLCVLTVSDTRTMENDTSGDWLCNALAEALGAAPGAPCAELVQRLTSGPAPPLPREMV